jgi:NAD(P)-dependent dehydrogenase (short-subunit alcohol dehydrogenase family)
MDISNISALVTGGASGLGRATAAMLAKSGARVAVLDLDSEQGRAFADSIGGVFVPLDISKTDAIDTALSAAEQAHGIARILVNCAGISLVAKTVGDDGLPCPSEIISRQIAINLSGTIEMLTRFAARLATAEPLHDERGVIINVASIAAYDGPAGQLAYAASKGGIISLTLPAARDLAPHRIRVMTIAPGMFETNMVSMLDAAGKARLGGQVPFPNRLGEPNEFADLVHHIIGNPMLNGSVIRLDGAHRLPFIAPVQA